jgi:hypothetical protein
MHIPLFLAAAALVNVGFAQQAPSLYETKKGGFL